MADLGFEVPPLSGSMLHHRHLAEVTLYVEGTPVTVEIHHKLCSDYFDSTFSYIRTAILGRQMEQDQSQTALDGVTGPPYPFTVGSLTAHTLGHEDALGYLFGSQFFQESDHIRSGLLLTYLEFATNLGYELSHRRLFCQ